MQGMFEAMMLVRVPAGEGPMVWKEKQTLRQVAELLLRTIHVMLVKMQDWREL